MSTAATPAVRRVLYVSGTRADFGLMCATLQRAAAHPTLDVSVLVTGTHLSQAHGHTVDEIHAAGLQVRAELPLDVHTRSPVSMAIAVAQCLQGAAQAMEQHRPHLLLLLGDRGEMLAGAVAALHMGVPSVHIHGGERSGTVDEPMRHAISKLCSYHLVATEESRERLVRMGEAPERIHTVGAPGLDGLTELAAGTRDEALIELGMPADKPFVLVVFHPVVQQAVQAHEQARVLIRALAKLNMSVLWLEPNADAGARGVLQALDETALPTGSRRAAHLGRTLFTKAMRHAAFMVGNSSAGVIEAASFGTPVVNLGDRQRLRQRNANVIDVAVRADELDVALQQALRQERTKAPNCYGDGHAAERIVQLLATLPLDAHVLEKTNAY